MRFSRVMNLLVVVCLLGAVACGADRDADPRFVRIAISSNPQSLDPAMATDVNGGDVCAKLYNGLVRFKGLDVEPDLAETWTVSANGLDWRFAIRRDVRFQNGREVTAEDVAYSFRRLLDTGTRSKRAWVLEAVESFEAVDSASFAMRLKRPTPAILSLLSMPACYVVPREEVEKHGDQFGRHPCGTGPYRFTRWEDDRAVELARNEDYFEGAPKVEGIIYRVIPEPLTQIALLRRGQLDICEIPDAQLPAVQSDPELGPRLQTVDQLVTVYVAINTERFADTRVRRAFDLAIDKKRIIETIRAGLATEAAGPVPPALMPGAIGPRPFDPVEAKRLLAEAGFDSTKPLVLLRSSTRGMLEATEAVAGYLRDIGLNVTVEPMEFSALRQRVNKGDFDLCLLNWYADYADAENFLAPLFLSSNVGSAGNRARLRDAAVDSAIERLSIPAGPERDQRILEAVRLVVDRAPWIFLWYPRTAVAVSPRLEGYSVPAIFNGDKGVSYGVRQ